jgi:hypothetical protein
MSLALFSIAIYRVIVTRSLCFISVVSCLRVVEAAYTPGSGERNVLDQNKKLR